MDIKSSNILLDHTMEARVSDFGLATLMKPDQTHVSTIIAGTFGYLVLESFDTGRATTKRDVYNFGVVLLKLLTGNRPAGESFIEEGTKLVTWAKSAIVALNCSGMVLGALPIRELMGQVKEERKTLLILSKLQGDLFCATAFASYAQATVAQEIFGHTLQSLRGIRYLYKQAELCKNCKQPGHYARECPNVAVCNNCGLPGHIAAECSTKALCWNCKEPGHLASKCPNEGICHNCGKAGHLARECTHAAITIASTTRLD